MFKAFVEKKPVVEKKPADLIFSKKDIFAPMNILSRLLRKIFYSKKITYNDFADMHNDYSDKLGLTKLERYSDKNNLLKGIQNDMITFRIFKVVLEKMGYLIVNLNIDLYNIHSGKNESFSVSINNKVKRR